MLRKRSGFLLAWALLLSLTACGTAGETASDPPAQDAPGVSTSPTPSEMSTPSVEPSAVSSEEPPLSPELEDYDLPDRDYQPWQTAYMDFLISSQTHKTTWEPMGGGAEVGGESYSLYDVDKDSVPELFVKFGTCEADYFARCYTLYTDTLGQDVVVMAAQFPFGHSSLYTCPDKSGFLRSEGHMGYHEIYEYGPLEDGSVFLEQEIFREEDVQEYTPVDEIVPGAEYIEFFYTRGGAQDDSFFTGETPYALGRALLLPVADWYDGPAATGSNSERARTAILAALNGERELYGASGDHFGGDVGPGTWEEYIQRTEGRPNTQVTADVAAYTWVDMNGDGQEECVLQMETEGVRDGETAWTGEAIIVLSEQNGTVYAYYFGVYYDSVFHEDGTILDGYGETRRLSFWKDQCYQYAVPDSSAQPVEWVAGAPGA